MKKNKFTFHFIVNIVLSILILTSLTFTIINIQSTSIISTVLLIVSIILAVILYQNNEKFLFYKNERLLLNLLDKKEETIHFKKNHFNDEFFENLENKLEFTKFSDSKNYSIYYKIDDGLTKAKKHKTLYALLFVHNDESFTSINLSNQFERLEKELSKNTNYRNRIFLQIKLNNEPINNEIIHDTENIFFFINKASNIVLLNLYYSLSTNSLYYLHTNKIIMPTYFNFAYQLIDELLKI